MTQSLALRPKSRDEIARAYASPPWWYDLRGFLILKLSYRSGLWSQLRFFGAHLAARHLEVAIGTGTLFGMILAWRRLKGLPSVSVVGVDYAESMLEGARRRFRRRRDIELEHADVAALSHPDDSFDSANIANALHCFPDVDGALREVRRVLRPGGTLAANVLLYPRGRGPLRRIAERINAWGVGKGILFTPYEQQDVRRRLLAAGFELLSEKVKGNTCSIVARKPTTAAARDSAEERR